ncbi:MAG TPA: hypothetical protein VFK50_07850, partial [Sphingomicrobium sp.]|nr:hypothetical protein [Sphingomicrobium sp.]
MATADNYSLTARPLWTFFGETKLGHATCFFIQGEGGKERTGPLYLITNWHVVTGQDAITLETLDTKTAGRPDSLTYRLFTYNGQPVETAVPLYRDGEPRWFVHPEFGRNVDMVAIPIDWPEKSVVFQPINGLPETALQTRVGMDIFILGFPFEP